MNMDRRLALGSLLVLAGGIAYAADQTVLGKSILVKNPSTPDKRKITIQGKEKTSNDSIVGNPTVSGATLKVSVDGGSPSSQTFNLPQGLAANGKPFWSGDATKGYKYKDSLGVNGAVKIAQIKKTPAGVFQVKATIMGKIGALSVVPPNPGNDSCSLLKIGGGDSYSVAIGAPTGALVSNNGAVQFKAKNPTSEASCYGSPSFAFVEPVLGILD